MRLLFQQSNVNIVSFIGKYSDFKSIIDSQDEANCSPPSGYLANSCGGTHSANNTNINLSLAEAQLLLHQASISSTQQQQQPIYQNSTKPGKITETQSPSSTTTANIINNNSTSNSGGKHSDSHYFRKSSSTSHHHGSAKTGYRKKNRSKSSRKAASYNLADSNLSDSDKN